jgi:hypothetical protein
MASAVLPLGLILSVIGLVVVVAPGGWRPGITDPARMFRGWPAFTADVEDLRRAQDAGWIATDDYNIAAELTYRLRDTGVPVEQITERIRYGFLPAPDADLTQSRALLLLRRDDIVRYADCLDGIAAAGTVERRGLGDRVWQTLTAYTVDSADAAIFQTGCDGGP